MIENLLYTGEIVLACFIVELGFRIYDARKNRRLDIGCDHCEEAKPLAKTPDKLYYLCKECYPAYMAENFPDLEPNIRKIFRRRRVKK